MPSENYLFRLQPTEGATYSPLVIFGSIMDQNITDASDFAQTAIPQLTQLDALLRCHICKDFLRVPVLTPCGHTFCSLCIREYLRKEPKCPLCLKELRESNLRSEFLVNEVTESYKSLRQPLLDFLNDNTPPTAETALIELVSQSDDDDDDIQILATSEKRRPKRRLPDATISANRVSKDSTKTNSLPKIRNEKNRPKEKMASCPICQNIYPIQALERTHLDECLTLQTLGKQRVKPENSIANRKLPSPRISDTYAQKSKKLEHSNQQTSHVERYLSSNNVDRQRLPKINFTSMSANQIKPKLASLGLPTNGSKQNMMARYNQYEMLWNSNFCDSLEPVTENELKRQLISWEVSHNNSNAPSSNNHTISTMMKRAKNNNPYQKLLMDFKTDKFERRSWISMFEKEFRTLIREARRNIVDRSQGQEDAKGSNTQEEILKTDS